MTSPREQYENKASNFYQHGLTVGIVICIVVLIVIEIARIFDMYAGGSPVTLIVLGAASMTSGFGVAYWRYIGPLNFNCPHCKRHQSNTDEPWVCRCGEAYSRSEEEPKSFINTVCRSCGRLPQTLHCPLCENGIPLGDIRNEDPRVWIKLAAFDYTAPLPEASPSDQYQQEFEELRHKENVHQQMLRVIQAENDIEEFKKDRSKRNRTPKEKIRASFDELLDTKISIHEVEKEMVKAVMDNVDDPEKRERLLRNIKAIRDEIENGRAYETDY